MTRFVVLLISFAAAAAAAESRPFSHKLHLQLKLQCVACHSTVTSSTQVSDNNLPTAKACQGCHQEVTIKQPEQKRVAKFDHSRHVKMGNIAAIIAAAIDSKAYLSDPGDIRKHLDVRHHNANDACTGCHRGLEESTAVSKDAFPVMADCLVCHNKIDPPFSCETCHQPGERLEPASHTPEWLELHSSGKANLDKASCAVCHGRKFTCRGCH